AQSEWLFKELFVLVCTLFFWRLFGKNAL
ncbi:DUF4149 domain-containing protein, partial [Helicobacter pylori]